MPLRKVAMFSDMCIGFCPLASVSSSSSGQTSSSQASCPKGGQLSHSSCDLTDQPVVWPGDQLEDQLEGWLVEQLVDKLVVVSLLILRRPCRGLRGVLGLWSNAVHSHYYLLQPGAVWLHHREDFTLECRGGWALLWIYVVQITSSWMYIVSGPDQGFRVFSGKFSLGQEVNSSLRGWSVDFSRNLFLLAEKRPVWAPGTCYFYIVEVVCEWHHGHIKLCCRACMHPQTRSMLQISCRTWKWGQCHSWYVRLNHLKYNRS